jgi:hypothetical protein
MFRYIKAIRRHAARARPIKSTSETGLSSKDEIEFIANSGLFDANWYKEKNRVKGDPLTHYVMEGASQGLAPHPLFHVNFYLSKISGFGVVARTPLGHFVVTNGRIQPTPHPLFDPEWYVGQYPDALHRDEFLFRDYLQHGGVQGLSPHPLFDVEWYAQQEPALADAGVNPLTHFVEIGALRGLNPNPFFDIKWYRDTHAAVVGDINPLVHYVTEGWKQRLPPSPLVDWDLYRREFDDVPTDDLSALKRLIRDDGSRYLTLVKSVKPVAGASLQRIDGSNQPNAGSLRRDAPLTAPVASSSVIFHDSFPALIASVARGRRVLEIGWDDNGTLGRAATACSAGAVDFRVLGQGIPTRAAQEFAQFLARYNTTGKMPKSPALAGPKALPTWLPYWSDTKGADEFIVNGNIFERDIRNKIGSADVIVAVTGLFHDREPLAMLRRLAYLTTEYVIFFTTIITPFEVTFASETVRFTENDMWPTVGLTAAQILAVELFWRNRGINLPQFEQFRSGLPWDQALKDGGWRWFFGEAAIQRLAHQADLDIIDVGGQWEGRGRCYLARRKGNSHGSAHLHRNL